MKRLLLPLTLLLFLVLEGTAMDFLPKEWLLANYYIIPHWVLVVLTYIAIFYDFDSTYYCVLYGIIFGLLIDLIYTDMLGVYMFTYGLVIYITHGFKKMLHSNVFVTLLLTIVAIVLADAIIYVLYSFIQATEMVWETYTLMSLLPTLAANVLFAVLLYPLLPGKLQEWSESQLKRSNAI
ncbi:rod shape-determining protein MreD [Pontibacillus yanchengensis]|uniref:Cell shape-determining protein n=1 Tax=Pontibacillus yanchengensis Y32 TaxID=1385514 RepID=A0A0A2TDK3_9BACI|nr:rod shape-determining protein MreD [Pontibacillus yanchengensis]KGP73887.1 cell shape-determining protein [Pontibacillus yanchengensis Y32]